MFIGHYAVGLAAKRAAPRTSLGLLLAAPTFLDLVWPIFLLLGWEEVRITPGPNSFLSLTFTRYPISHSLLTTLGWSALFALVYLAMRGDRRGALVLALLVTSHWVLDAVVHRPDLPLYPGDATRVGLGLWNSVAGTMVVELAMFAAGVWLYLSTTAPRDRTGRLALWSFVIFAIVIYVGNSFGPPPPSVRAVALLGLSGWLVPFWGAWIDRHRVPRSASPAPLSASPPRTSLETSKP
jgi:hypothetical protein